MVEVAESEFCVAWVFGRLDDLQRHPSILLPFNFLYLLLSTVATYGALYG
jgi:hypothetical protein